MNIKRKWLERKIALTEKEIKSWESKLSSAEVYLRVEKKKLWELMDLLEQEELKEGVKK